MPKASFWHCFALSFYAFWPPSLAYLLSSQASDMLCFKKQRKGLLKKWRAWFTSGLHMHGYSPVSAHTHNWEPTNILIHNYLLG